MGLETAEVNVLELVSEVLAAHSSEPARNTVEVAVQDPFVDRPRRPWAA